MLDEQLLAMLVCPQCRGKLTEHENTLHCDVCQLAYPIEDGIPIMLVDQARPLTP